jgi:hypothetical protein
VCDWWVCLLARALCEQGAECALSTFDLDWFGVQVLFVTFWQTQDLDYGISNEVLLVQSEASVTVLYHGGQLRPPTWALVGQNQVLGLCELNSGSQRLHQLGQVGRVFVVSGIFMEWAFLVVEMLFVLGFGGQH